MRRHEHAVTGSGLREWGKRIVIAAAVVACAGGCSMMPRYERPALPVPERFPATPFSEIAEAPGDSLLHWRDYFTDARLRQVIDLAIANNRDLRIAALNVERAAAMYRVQRSQLIPTFGVQASGQKMRVPERMTESGDAETSEQYTVEAGFMSWEIDLFGRLRSLKAAAKEQYLATDATRRAVHISLVAGVAATWLGMAADLEHLYLAEATIEAQAATRDLVKSSRDAGVASDLDLSQAESQVEMARANRAQFMGAIAVDRHALELLAGGPIPDSLLPGNLSGVPEMPALAAGLASEVLLTRPDILAAEHLLRAANADVGAARAALFPRISLTAALGTLSPDLEHLFAEDTGTWRYAPLAQLPIYGGGGPRANLKATRIQREIAVAAYEKAIQTAFAETANALALQSTLVEQREAWDRLLDSLTRTLELSEARYQTGLEGYLGVLVAQRTLYASQQSAVDLRLADIANRVALYKALGGGWR